MPALFEPNLARIEASVPSAAYYATATNDVATVTLPAMANECHLVEGVAFSYGSTGSLSGGVLTISVGSVARLVLDISAKGHDAIPLGWVTGANEAFVATLAAGGSSVVGRLTLLGVKRAFPRDLPGAEGQLDFSDPLDGLELIGDHREAQADLGADRQGVIRPNENPAAREVVDVLRDELVDRRELAVDLSTDLDATFERSGHRCAPLEVPPYFTSTLVA